MRENLIMGRPGRPPKPSGLRLLEGTDKKGRSGRIVDRTREPIAPDGDLEPPYELSEEKQGIWDQTVAALEAMGVASPADVNQVAAYVEAVYLHRWATREMTSQALMVAGARSDVTNKLLIIQAKAAVLVLRFAQEFGLTPSARTRIDVNPFAGGGGSGPRKPNPFAG
jgi:P27 family predicted phage terminase small subunit